MFLPLLAILALVGEAKMFSAVAVILCVVLLIVILLKLLHLGVFILLHPHALGMLGVGTSLSLGVTVKPIQWITSFLVPRERIPLEVRVDGVREDVAAAHDR